MKGFDLGAIGAGAFLVVMAKPAYQVWYASLLPMSPSPTSAMARTILIEMCIAVVVVSILLYMKSMLSDGVGDSAWIGVALLSVFTGAIGFWYLGAFVI